MEKLSGLSHLFMTIFLHNFSTFMGIPAITDVTMSAICPGRDECSLAIYLTGFQQAVCSITHSVFSPFLFHLNFPVDEHSCFKLRSHSACTSSLSRLGDPCGFIVVVNCLSIKLICSNVRPSSMIFHF